MSIMLYIWTNKLIIMKNSFLFPKIFRALGFVLIIPFAILGYFVLFQDFSFDFLQLMIPEDSGLPSLRDYNLTNELVGIVTLFSLLFIAFSKEEIEDEMVHHLRLNSLLCSVYLVSIINILAIMLIHDTNYLAFTVLNIFMVPFLFSLRFFYSKYKMNSSNEK